MRSDPLEGARHVLVTGAAGAIGGALAKQLAEAAPNAQLSLVDKRPIEVVARARSYMWDLSKPDALADAYEEVAREEPVDVLVNCAGFIDQTSRT